METQRSLKNHFAAHISIMKPLKEEAHNHPPKEGVSIVYEEKGDMMGANILGLETVTRFQTCITMSTTVFLYVAIKGFEIHCLR